MVRLNRHLSDTGSRSARCRRAARAGDRRTPAELEPSSGALRRRSGPDLIGAIPFGPRDHQTPDSDAAPEGRAAGVGELVGERIDCGSLVGKEVLGGFTLCEAIAVSSNSIHGVTAEGPVARAAAGEALPNSTASMTMRTSAARFIIVEPPRAAATYARA